MPVTDLIVEMQFGSHLYGTSTPSSDTDIKAVHLPPGRDILLQRARPVQSHNTKTDGAAKNAAGDIDRESYALHKYLALVAEGQTVATDMLFAPPASWTEHTPGWLDIRANTHRLISRNCKSFVGYCRQQANKYGIKGSRMAACRAARDLLAEALEKHGSTAKLEMVAPELAAFVAGREHTNILDIPVADKTMTVRHLEVCNRKAPFTSTIKLAFEVYDRLFAEYGQRARAAEANQGVDWKALSHAVRVGREAIELLSTGRVTFPRPEAAHLIAIKRGELSYHPVAEEIETLLAEVEATAARSTLPDTADTAFIEDLIAEHYRRAVAA